MLGGGTMGGGIAGHLAGPGCAWRSSTRRPSWAERPRSGCSSARAGTSRPGCCPPRRSSAPRAVEHAAGPRGRGRRRRPRRGGGARGRRAQGRTCSGAASRRRAGRGDHRVEHLLAADRGPRGRRCASPARFLGVHWFNPPEWTPGIEVIAGGRDRAARPSTACVELPARRRQAPGRGAPTARASSPTGCRWRCCARRSRCVEEGLATPRGLDEVVRSTFGFRLPFFGPFLIADMAGLDVYASVFETLERDGRARVRRAARRCASTSTPGAPARRAARASATYSERGAGDAAARARPPLRGARRAARRAGRPGRDRRVGARGRRRRDRRRDGRQAHRRTCGAVACSTRTASTSSACAATGCGSTTSARSDASPIEAYADPARARRALRLRARAR